MAEQPPQNSNVQKRIKQIENQNIKFKSLLKNALDVSQKEASGISKLQEEADYLKKTIDNLEREKTLLEGELNAVLGGTYNSEVRQRVAKLEKEHDELQLKLTEVLKEIDREHSEIENLRAEDKQLKQILAELENEKKRILSEIVNVDAMEGNQSSQSIKLHEQLNKIENKKTSLTQRFQEEDNQPPISDILSNFKTLEKTYKDYVEALQEHVSLKEKVSELEQKNEELIKVVQKTESEEMRIQTKLNESIIHSNTSLLEKISNVKSRIQNNLELNSDFMKTLESPEVLESKISELENEKNALYDDLERTLENSTYEVGRISEDISDQEIKRLINEIEIQKSVLLYSLKSLKLKVEPMVFSGYDTPMPSIPESKSEAGITEIPSVPATSGLHQLLDSTIEGQCADNKSTYETAMEEHSRLEEEISRLEQEKDLLMMQLQSLSASSASPYHGINTGSNSRNERQLQTPSELHSTFMHEESSHEIIVAPNYDDATNQLYADEEARLEQRIRELENENARIKRELDSILTEIRNDKSEMCQLQVTGEMLRQRLEELENKNTTHKKF